MRLFSKSSCFGLQKKGETVRSTTIPQRRGRGERTVRGREYRGRESLLGIPELAEWSLYERLKGGEEMGSHKTNWTFRQTSTAALRLPLPDDHLSLSLSLSPRRRRKEACPSVLTKGPRYIPSLPNRSPKFVVVKRKKKARQLSDLFFFRPPTL